MKGEDFMLSLQEVRDGIGMLMELDQDERNWISIKVQSSGEDELAFTEFANLFLKEDTDSQLITKTPEEQEIDKIATNFKKKLLEKISDLQIFKKTIATNPDELR